MKSYEIMADFTHNILQVSRKMHVLMDLENKFSQDDLDNFNKDLKDRSRRFVESFFGDPDQSKT